MSELSGRLGSGRVRCGRGAFTLVELLVVVAIIAALVTILVPTLQRAREVTRRAICQVNLRHLVVAANVYAEDWEGEYPPYKQSGAYRNRSFLPYNTRNVYNGEIRMPKTRKLVPLNLCMVYEAGLLASPKSFYCPGQELSYYRYDRYPQPFSKDNMVLPGYWRTAYLYNPHVIGYERAYTRKDEFPPKKVFVMDILHEERSIAHRGMKNEPGWNLAFADGGATYRTSEKAHRLIQQYYYVGNSWFSFDKARNDLEGVEGP